MVSRSICFLSLASLLAILTAFGCKKTETPNGNSAGGKNGLDVKTEDDPQANFSETEKQIHVTTESEELIQSLAKQMSLLNKSFQDRSTDTRKLVAYTVSHRALKPFEIDLEDLQTNSDSLVKKIEWPIADAKDLVDVPLSEVWKPLLDKHVFESCQFGTVGSRFINTGFQTDTKFEGRFRTESNELVGVVAHQTLQWHELNPGSWRITQWHQTDFHLVAAPEALFEDVTKEVFPDDATFKKVQRSSHEDMILKNVSSSLKTLKPPKRKFKDFADWESGYQYPAASVVDIDQDGFDDLFLTDRWQAATLLRNRGDGTFEDVTESSGLEIKELASSAFFADFDNDGDSDLFVAGTLEPCRYYENVGGVFNLDETLHDEYKDMLLVVSGSVVDVNGDGLLDIYLNTYGFGTGWSDDSARAWSDTIIRVEDRVKMRLKVERSHWYLDRGGAPNILLLNEGGKLKRANIDDTLAQWRNSYQTVWSDFDDDGDQDLYICNDFAPDYFLRNDTERGSFEPKFAEVTKEMVPDGTMGFGMGANWGDYNNDGALDLYVSNMYSKAGNRIVANFEEVDERVKVAARGNFLYEKQGERFKQVAGLEDDSQHVSKVGWSFGGQFADFDNDGNLDVYVPSGFFTPPEEVQKSGDW